MSDGVKRRTRVRPQAEWGGRWHVKHAGVYSSIYIPKLTIKL